MDRIVVSLVVAVVILGPIISLTAVGATQSTDVFPSETADDKAVTSNSSGGVQSRNSTIQTATEPGAQFVGVVGAHREQHTGTVKEQTVTVRISRADSPREKAELVATIHQQNTQRLDKLAERRQAFARAYQNGTMSESEYSARLAILDVELRSVERVASRLEEAADGLSLSLLLDVGIDPADIDELRTRAQDMQGSDLTMIAPSFARDPTESETGLTPSPRSGDTTETPTDGNVSVNVSAVLADAEGDVQTARERVSQADQTVDETLVSETVSELLTRARENLSTAEGRLAAARAAQEDGDEQRAIELANEAIRFARTAIDQADRAIDEATDVAKIDR